MNKKVKGICIFLLGLSFLYLLLNENSIKNSIRGENEFIKIILYSINSIFGKMSWFMSFFLIGIGLFYFFLGHVKLKFHRFKIVSLIIWYIAWSILLINKYIPLPLTSNFLEAGREILEIGFNGESGGFIGAIISMPLYKIIHLKILNIFLIIIITICIIIIFREFFVLFYTLIIGLIKYYRSEEYSRKIKLLKAKKIVEKQKYFDEQKRRREKLKRQLIESRKQKLNYELSKKPKDSFLKKTEIYSESELIDKEKEWNEFIERKKRNNVNRTKSKIADEMKNNEKNINKKKENNDGVEDKDRINKEDIEKIKNLSKEKTVIDKNFEKNSDENFVEDSFDKFQKNKKIEENANVEEIINKELLDETFVNTGEYEELLEKSINEIFKSKPMDEQKKREIEMGIVQNVSHLEDALKEFGIDAKVVNYEYGPTITRYEITIPKGVKVSKVSGLQDDIQLSLAAKSVRIEAPIPGRNTIGIEVPNRIKEPVHFSNMIRNPKLEKGELNIILGKNIVGEDKIIDIVKMPHLLIAGQTGSGKSVAVNTLISTLISKKTEKEVKFIMVDPKMVELMPYNGIPHLLVPVIIDPKQAAIALKWAVNEMENRYRSLMENGVRNIVGYNSLGYVEKMPYIVVIIDELADLMMVASGSVEESIARIAQKARAVGIHLIVATQRPSTDVITGMIKANLPSRISFSLRSQIDSRTILDSPGAEKLLGQGDMLLLENGSSNSERIQGAWISDEEVVQLTSALKKNRKVSYMEEILIDTSEGKNDLDPLFENAIDVIRQERKVSISLLQRKLSVGFNRAAKIYDQLKDNGIISDDNNILIDIDDTE